MIIKMLMMIMKRAMITNYDQVKKEKQEFTVKMREGDSFLMPQVKVINMMLIMARGVARVI